MSARQIGVVSADAANELLRQSVRVAVSSAVDSAHLLRSHVDGTGVCAGGGSGGVLQDSPNATTWTLEPDLLQSEASSSEQGQGGHDQVRATYSGVPTGRFHIKNTVSERPTADCLFKFKTVRTKTARVVASNSSKLCFIKTGSGLRSAFG